MHRFIDRDSDSESHYRFDNVVIVTVISNMATATTTNADGVSASIQKPKRKVGRPGRKKIDTEAKNRRTAQNRAAQRAFRERKEQKLKSLENKISTLEKINEQSEYESILLKNHLADLIHEITKFRPKSEKDLQIIDLLTRNNVIKEELKLQNLKEDENIANLDNPKGNTTNVTTPITKTEQEPDFTMLKNEIKYTPNNSNSPMSINSNSNNINNNNNNDLNNSITEQSLFAAAAAEDIAAAMGNNNYGNISYGAPATMAPATNNSPSYMTNTGVIQNNYNNNGLLSVQNSSNSSPNDSININNKNDSTTSSRSNMDIIDDLFNAAYSFDHSNQFGSNNNNNNDISLSASSISHSDINSEYNMTNHFPNITNDTNMFSMYGTNNNTNNSDKKGAFGQTIPQFTLNNLTNTWNNNNNNFNTTIADPIPSTGSSEIDIDDLGAIQYAFDVKPTIQDKTTIPKTLNNNTNMNGTPYMSFLNNSLAFPDMDDNITFKDSRQQQQRQAASSCSSAKPNCSCSHDNVDKPVSDKPIKCELLTRHIINDESIRSILKDKNFIATGTSTTASACAADCDGKRCNKVTLPYHNCGSTMKCADIWRHITTLPKYSDVDIDNLCDELMTKINYSEDGITIKPRDFQTALKEQVMA